MPSSFSYNAKSIFLTYAQCPEDREVLLDLLKTKVGNDRTNQLVKACIGQERHADGGLHLHACAWYTHKLRFNDVRYLDLNGHHPNIKDCRIKRKDKALKYCAKEDPNPLQFNMDIKEETEARESHRKILGKRLLEGEKLVDLVDENPALIFEFQKLEANLAAYKR